MDAVATFRNGLGRQNPGLVQLLGLCPLLAVSTTLGNALGLGIATLAVLLASSLAASLVGRWLLPEVRIGVFVVTIAAAVTAVELVAAAWLPELHQSLGIFLPLIAVNCAILGGSLFMVERDYTLSESAVFGFGSGFGFWLAIVALAAIREKMRYSNVPPQLRGLGITFIMTGLMAIAFMAFAGIQL